MSKVIALLLVLLVFVMPVGGVEASGANTFPSVVIFTLSTCSHCKAAKRYMTENDIPFENREIDSSAANLAELTKIYDYMGVAKSARGVPLIIVGGRIRLQGFDKVDLQKALQEAAK